MIEIHDWKVKTESDPELAKRWRAITFLPWNHYVMSTPSTTNNIGRYTLYFTQFYSDIFLDFIELWLEKFKHIWPGQVIHPEEAVYFLGEYIEHFKKRGFARDIRLMVEDQLNISPLAATALKHRDRQLKLMIRKAKRESDFTSSVVDILTTCMMLKLSMPVIRTLTLRSFWMTSDVYTDLHHKFITDMAPEVYTSLAALTDHLIEQFDTPAPVPFTGEFIFNHSVLPYQLSKINVNHSLPRALKAQIQAGLWEMCQF